jgi:predicted nucleic-acid-binding protein
MIAVDTNVLVRLVVKDDPDQFALAERLVREAAESGEPCLVSDPVLCELEWVLESSYGASRSDVLAAMQNLLARGAFVGRADRIPPGAVLTLRCGAGAELAPSAGGDGDATGSQ